MGMRSWLGLGDLKTMTILSMVVRVFIPFLPPSLITVWLVEQNKSSSLIAMPC